MLKAVQGSARVLLQGKIVGDLVFRAGGSTFRYTDDLLDPEHQVLGQVFEESPRQQFREPVGLPAWFANLLPEQGSGLRRYYASRYGERELDDARLLLTLGGDLPGAATVEPVDVPAEGVLVEAAETLIAGDGLHLSALAGAQLKMSVLRDGDRLTLPASGESGGWIAKLPDRLFPGLAENELLMMRWAALAGLDVPRVDLVPAAGIPPLFGARLEPGASVYVVERFDRTTGGRRVHMEDLAQVAGRLPIHRDHDATYDGIGRLLLGLTGSAGFAEYLRRLVAMVLMGNGDAHLKNWSIWYPDGRTAALAPAYDLVCTTIYSNLPNRLTFPVGGINRPDAVTVDALLAVAATAGFPTDDAAEIVKSAGRALTEAWLAVRHEGRNPDLVEHLDRRLDRHPLLH
jgi:serine/threonine-protein kinase HipA